MNSLFQSVARPVEQQHVPLAGPWPRYAARLTDMLLFGVFLALLPGWNELALRNLGGMISGLVWIPFEALMVAFVSTTPGKWLYRVRVTQENGEALELPTSVRRSLEVWLVGLGMGIHLLAIILMPIWWMRVRKGQTTSWDIACFSQVCQMPRTGLCTAAAVTGTLLAAFLAFVVRLAV